MDGGPECDSDRPQGDRQSKPPEEDSSNNTIKARLLGIQVEQQPARQSRGRAYNHLFRYDWQRNTKGDGQR